MYANVCFGSRSMLHVVTLMSRGHSHSHFFPAMVKTVSHSLATVILITTAI